MVKEVHKYLFLIKPGLYICLFLIYILKIFIELLSLFNLQFLFIFIKSKINLKLAYTASPCSIDYMILLPKSKTLYLKESITFYKILIFQFVTIQLHNCLSLIEQLKTIIIHIVNIVCITNRYLFYDISNEDDYEINKKNKEYNIKYKHLMDGT